MIDDPQPGRPAHRRRHRPSSRGIGKRTSTIEQPDPEPNAQAAASDRVRPSASRSFSVTAAGLGAAVVAVVAVVGAGVFASATQPAFACSNIWTPDPTASPAADASPQPGYVQPDMGNTHVAVGTVVKYTYCRPASASIFASGQGPIPARPYGPNDTVIPEGWVHNLEHGGLVILYKGDRCGSDGPARAVRRRAGEPGCCDCSLAATRPALSWSGSTTWRGRMPHSSGTASCRCRRSTRRGCSTSTPATASGRTRRRPE